MGEAARKIESYEDSDSKEVRSEKIKGKGAQVIDFKAKVEQMAHNDELRTMLFEMVEKVDDTSFMKAIRKGWDTAPKPMQWVLLHSPIITLESAFFKLLYKLGLVEYKGAKPQDDREALTQWEAKAQEWALKVASIFVPEMKAFKETMDQALKKVGYKGGFDEFIGHQNEIKKSIFADTREHLKGARHERNDREKAKALETKILSNQTAENDSL